ncbi:MAG: filamentous hemagglutinin N-terminal domain-containing protein [Xenococcaceae cyanobacterium MO_188.B19]|nr:filamentous hemagglutinin N-terminal domain-containing protein [Xenococcaceae cyanobacterium MO_188.B19]
MLGIKSQVSQCGLTLCLLIANCTLTSENAQAQIVTDGTLDSQVNLIDGQNVITGGKEARTNLFHSFEQFSPVPEAATYFNNNSNIENIFTRVTGNIPSFINGTIQTNDASLFLLNPSGIIFGENARLDINGSFFATSAESVIFADGTTFNTKVSNTTPLLTVSMPIGLQYGANPGTITSNNITGSLKEGEIIALLGGEVSLQNTLISEVATAIEIVGVGKGETIWFEHSNGGWQFDYSDVAKFADINIGSNVFLDSAGIPVSMNIQGNNITINSSFLINTNNTDNDGGNISLKASNSIILNQSLLATQSSTFPSEPDFIPVIVEGDGGDISIKAREIIITNGSQINASNFSKGNGGNIDIEAQDYLEISGVGILLNPDPNEPNEPFSLILPSFIEAGVGPIGSGSGGNINIKSNRLNITDGGRIDSRTTSIFETGKAGTIEIEAKSLQISGVGEAAIFSNILNEKISETITVTPSSIAVIVTPSSNARGGNIILKTNELNLFNGGRIDSSTLGTGNAGSISVDSIDSIAISGKNGELHSGVFATSGEKDSLIPTGRSGDININTSQLLLQQGGQISVEAEVNSDGGNIMINTNNLTLLDDSKITANAQAGNGGNIMINTQGLFPPDAVEKKQIDASSNLGIDGTIDIIAPDIDSKINAKLQERSPIATEKLISSSCGLNSDFNANQFRYIGRGGISPSPLTIITEDIVGELGTVEYIQETKTNIDLEKKGSSANISETTTTSIDSNPIQEATTWKINDRGNVELVAQSPNVARINSDCPMSNY